MQLYWVAGLFGPHVVVVLSTVSTFYKEYEKQHSGDYHSVPIGGLRDVRAAALQKYISYIQAIRIITAFFKVRCKICFVCPTKCRVFDTSVFFGSCSANVLRKECAKIWVDHTIITNLMHWLLFIRKILLLSSTCFEYQVLIFRRT